MTSGAGCSLYPGLPTTTLHLSLSGKALPKKDVLSKSDPVCVVFFKSKDEWIEAGEMSWVRIPLTINEALLKHSQETKNFNIEI
jgi:hypothetical protein